MQTSLNDISKAPAEAEMIGGIEKVKSFVYVVDKFNAEGDV